MGDEVEHATPKAPPLKRPQQRHRVPHYVVLLFNLVVAVACFAGAGALVLGQNVVNNQKKTEAITNPATTARTPISAPDATDATGDTSGEPPTSDAAATTTTEPFPIADPTARNFLITGSDNGGCASTDSANPIEERDSIGERSDTIIVMRVDPSTSRAAILSFPRDLWVKIAGTNKRSRINSAYSVNEPQKLVDTIYENFGIGIDHYIQIDFCAFKVLVDSVGGVAVPFEFPAQDRNTGLDVPTAGCFNFDGDGALAYVRSRHYKYLDPDTNTFKEDGSSDYGRIARQQDFLRRAVAKVLSQGVFDIGVARGLIEVSTKYVVTDPDLTLEKQLEFAGVLKNLDPNDIRTYRVEGKGTTISGASVIEPRLEGPNMLAILSIFRGQAQLETAPDQVFDGGTPTSDFSTTTTLAPTTTTDPTTTTTTDDAGGGSPGGGAATATTRPASSATTTSTTSPATTTTVPAATTTTLPTVVVEQTVPGIVPPEDVQC